MPEFCAVEHDGHLRIIKIERPDAMNALHPPATAELSRAFDEFEADAEAWVAILTAAGERAFCVGTDLKHPAGPADEFQLPESGFGGLTARFDMVKPVIAAVNGIAAGGGFELALAADIIVAARHAQFTLPEVKHGLAALAGGVHRLPRSIGVHRAMGLVLTGRRVSADEGLELGFVNEVVPGDELMAAARRWAEAILATSPMSGRASKQAMLCGLDLPGVRAATKASYPAVDALLASEDLREGVSAFREKRRPVWNGR
jgi:acetyl-CoA C-acetyltransferase